MRMQFSKFAYVAGILLALTFAFSCSSSDNLSGGDNKGDGSSNSVAIVSSSSAAIVSSSSVNSDISSSSSDGEIVSSSSAVPGSSPAPSSSSAALSSSSSTPSSSSSVHSSSSAKSSSSSSEEAPSSCDEADKCGGKCYNKSEQFCSVQDNKIYDKCENSVYNTNTYFCLSGVRTVKCDGYTYEDWQFCSNNLIKAKCGEVASGSTYNPSTEQCCGTSKYTTATQFCQSPDVVKDLCGTATYDATQICEGGIVKNFCGTAKYNATTQFCDSRDVKPYKFVTIGTQTWMAENLNYNASGSKCYDNLESNCTRYGRLYNWATAMSACPSGWHLPSDAELGALMKAVGGTSMAGKYLKAKSGWNSYQGKSGNGEDKFGFAALPSGLGKSDGDFSNVGYDGHWWSSWEDGEDGTSTIDWYMGYGHENVYASNIPKKIYLLSVRCVQD